MLKLSANLSFLYQELPFLDRFKAAAKDGFKGVEYLFPYEWESSELLSLLNENGLQQVLFNASAGDWAAGEKGLASLSGREQEFRDSIFLALEYATALQCPQIHIMAGLRDETISHSAQLEIYHQNLAFAAEECAKRQVVALIEPINAKDMPGFFLENISMAASVLNIVDHPSLRIQFDMYHIQRTDGDICLQFLANADKIGHIQIANPPHRYEPGNGEINYPYIFNFLKSERYSGWIGCEYKPSTTTSKTLGWAKELLTQ
ncbi:TIM barrel protein [Sneathiella marina]|uniref:TIM barrel protein n=1 Tax=Sneathiella marina TaxID=2950108 RepID=A0ABY4W2P6_9PROT|nr:2-oxo-tetronate isomerase [Sneathiella marina]USG60383.1 TIM barrel protein [Sneathiella marina]